MIKLIIFDLDGTLADTLDDIGDAVNMMLSDFSFPTLTRKEVTANINRGARELIRRSLPEEKREDSDLVTRALEIYESYYSKCYCNKTYLYEGIRESLKSLSESEVKLAVLSNKQDPFVKHIISELLPDIPFSFVLGQGQFPTKPSPDAVNYILSSLGVNASETAFVGDSHVDMITAKNTGTHAVGVTWGYRSPEVLKENGAEVFIDRAEDLKDIPSLISLPKTAVKTKN